MGFQGLQTKVGVAQGVYKALSNDTGVYVRTLFAFLGVWGAYCCWGGWFKLFSTSLTPQAIQHIALLFSTLSPWDTEHPRMSLPFFRQLRERLRVFRDYALVWACYTGHYRGYICVYS